MVGVIATFAVVAVLLSAVPGPDTLLVPRRRPGEISLGADSLVTAPGARTARGAFLYGLARACGCPVPRSQVDDEPVAGRLERPAGRVAEHVGGHVSEDDAPGGDLVPVRVQVG